MGGDKFYPNGKKMYDGFHKHYYHENGQKAYDGIFFCCNEKKYKF